MKIVLIFSFAATLSTESFREESERKDQKNQDTLNTGSAKQNEIELPTIRTNGDNPATKVPLSDDVVRWNSSWIKYENHTGTGTSHRKRRRQVDPVERPHPGCSGIGNVSMIATTLEDIQHFLCQASNKYKGITKLMRIGQTVEGRTIHALKIHDEKTSDFKTVVLEFGIHAREWASPQSAMFVIQQLLKEGGRRITDIRWFIVAVLNPDGYDYTFKKDSFWRKNRRAPVQACAGVDLNRNFGVAWNKELSKDECAETFSGPEAFSEPETRAMRDFVDSIKPTPAAYVGIHSCAQGILHPYGYKREAPASVDLLRKIGGKMAAEMFKVRTQKYRVQQSYELARGGGAVGGGSDDYMFEHLKIPLVFTIELGDVSYGQQRNFDWCFHPHTYMLMYYLTKECHFAIVALSDHILEEMAKEKQKLRRQQRKRPITYASRETRVTLSGLLNIVSILAFHFRGAINC